MALPRTIEIKFGLVEMLPDQVLIMFTSHVTVVGFAELEHSVRRLQIWLTSVHSAKTNQLSLCGGGRHSLTRSPNTIDF